MRKRAPRSRLNSASTTWTLLSVSALYSLYNGRGISYNASAVYENEQSVGKAIRASGIAREKLFVTTKYDGGDVERELRKSLADVRAHLNHTNHGASGPLAVT
jgi:hypothetical protein